MHLEHLGRGLIHSRTGRGLDVRVVVKRLQVHFIIVHGCSDQIDIAAKGNLSMFSLTPDIVATETSAPSTL